MSRSTQEQGPERYVHFDYGAITLWGFAFQQILLCSYFVTFRLTSVPALQPLYMPRTLRLHRTCAAHTGLGCSPFARRYFGNIQLFSFPLGTEMFHFPRFALYIVEYTVLKPCEFPHSEISGSKVATRLPGTFRSYATSFIASYSQGIHHMLLGSIGNPKNHFVRHSQKCRT